MKKSKKENNRERLIRRDGSVLVFPDSSIMQMIWEIIAIKQSPLPKWVLANTHYRWEAKGNDVWIHDIYLTRKNPELGFFLDTLDNGSKMLARIDPSSGEKKYVIMYEPPQEDWVCIFQVEVNIASKDMFFIKDTVLSELDPNLFEIFS